MSHRLLPLAIALPLLIPGPGAAAAQKKKVRPFLGITPDYGAGVKGVKIEAVSKKGPAEVAGLKAGDVIVKLGDEKIGDLRDFVGALRFLKVGVMVRVVVKRKGKEKTFPLVPAARKK